MTFVSTLTMNDESNSGRNRESCKEAAHRLSSQGFKIFPVHGLTLTGRCMCGDARCANPAKHPLTANGLRDATADPIQIEKWWTEFPRANIGLRPDGLIVLDIDAANGEQGNSSLQLLEAKFGLLPKTVTVRTGSGGFHYYFRVPQGTSLVNRAQALGKMYPDIDVRTSEGYVLVPPSKHICGERYKWLPGCAIDECSIADMPDWLIDVLRGASNNGSESTLEPGRPRQVHIDTELDGDSGTTNADYWLQKYLEQAKRGNRNDVGFKLAQQLRDTAQLTLEDALPVMERYQAAVADLDPHDPYRLSEALNSLKQAYRRPPRDPARACVGQQDGINGDADGGSCEAPAEVADSRSESEGNTSEPKRAAVRVNNRSLNEKIADAIAALKQHNHPPQVFQRDGTLVRVRRDEQQRAMIETMTPDRLRGYLAEVADFENVGKGGKITIVDPPDAVVRGVLNAPEWPFPVLLSIAEMPIFRGDGTIFGAPGYDPDTGLFLTTASDFTMAPVAEHPTSEELDRARNLLMHDVLGDFCWADHAGSEGASQANALALLLTPLIRHRTTRAPMAVITAPKAGIGKSLLANIVSIVATGHAPMVTTMPESEEEVRKKISTLLRSGRPVLIWDNATETLRSDQISAALTSDTWIDRLLGSNDEICVRQRATWVFTGNNLVLGGDLSRRCYWIRLDAQTARPWERDVSLFKHPDLEQWVSQHRGEIIWALLTLARAWFAAGCPKAQTAKLGSFVEWTDIVGGILEHAGIHGFLQNQHEMYKQADVDDAAWEGFLLNLASVYEREPFSAKELYTLAHGNNLAADYLEATLPEELADCVGGRNDSLPRFAKRLALKRGTRYGELGLRLMDAGKLHGTQRWRIAADTPDFIPRIRSERDELSS